MAQRQPTHNTVRRNTAKKKKSKYRGWIRGLAIVLGVLVCVCGGTLVWAYGKYKDIQANPFDTFKKPTKFLVEKYGAAVVVSAFVSSTSASAMNEVSGNG